MSEPTGNAQADLTNLHIDRYEAAWIRISLITTAIFALAVITASVSYGIHVPGVHQRIKPDEIMAPGSPFADPKLQEVAPGKYEVYIRAATWSFTPGEIRVPVGSTVTFYITSIDVQHGFKLMDTNINMMVLPGQVSTLSATFDKPGTFNFVCHEFCGGGGPTIGHHTMYGQLIVEEPVAAQ